MNLIYLLVVVRLKTTSEVNFLSRSYKNKTNFHLRTKKKKFDFQAKFSVRITKYGDIDTPKTILCVNRLLKSDLTEVLG